MTEILTKIAYNTFQQGKSYFGLAHKSISTQLLNFIDPPRERRTNPLSPQLLLAINERLDRLREIDWEDADRGVYPRELLFTHSWDEFFRYYPLLCLDLLRVWNRSQQKKNQEFSSQIDTTGYPRYYLQNFHYQTDGYLSDCSANLYDLQVDILFNGAADAMRRRILTPLKHSLKTTFSSILPKHIRILDVACGTGRTLQFIRATLPQASLFGTDLSPAYLRKAHQLLSQHQGQYQDQLPQLFQANAEDLPFRENYFHALTSVFLFHELPPTARQSAIDECFRVTQPGGVFIICDSIQAIDSPELQPVMENFCGMFHEPYYMNYIKDDLVDRLEKAGFTHIEIQHHFMSKYWIARKPHRSE